MVRLRGNPRSRKSGRISRESGVQFSALCRCMIPCKIYNGIFNIAGCLRTSGHWLWGSTGFWQQEAKISHRSHARWFGKLFICSDGPEWFEMGVVTCTSVWISTRTCDMPYWFTKLRICAINICFQLSIYLTVYLSVYLPVYVFICLPIYLHENEFNVFEVSCVEIQTSRLDVLTHRVVNLFHSSIQLHTRRLGWISNTTTRFSKTESPQTWVSFPII